MQESEPIETVSRWIARSERIIVFTGAGVSTESGIPDFRSAGGIWDRYDPNEFYFSKFVSSETSRKLYWKMHSELFSLLATIEPNPAHEACVELDRLGKLECVITQNVDNLHQRAGLAPDKVIEIHGNALEVGCLDCDARHPRAEVQEWLDAGEEVPLCRQCGGLLKPRTVSFGQGMPVDEMQEAEIRMRRCDLFIVIGSSLVVHPAALMPAFAKDNGAKLVIINLTNTPFDEKADLLICGKAGEVMAEIIPRVKQLLIN
jgi:NAD-dependent deacetylase